MQEENQKNTKDVQFSDILASEHKELFSQFIHDYEAALERGEQAKSGNQDVQYFLSLQKKRLAAHGVECDIDIEPYGYIASTDKFLDLVSSFNFRSAKFAKALNSQTVLRSLRFCKNSRTVYKEKKKDYALYEAIVSPAEEEIENIHDTTYVCSSCGNITTVENLLTACPYCRTRYLIKDLFPKVNNFYFQEDLGKKEVASIKNFVIFVGLICLAALSTWRFMQEGFSFLLLLNMLAVSIPIFFFVYLARAIFTLFRLIKLGIKQQKLLNRGKRNREWVTSQLWSLDPSFNYEYFVSKTLTLLRILLFHPNVQQFPQFAANAFPAWGEQIVHLDYQGVVEFKNLHINNGYLELELAVPLILYFHDGKRIIRRKQDVNLKIVHKHGVLAKPDYSVKKVTCHYCAGSFDASSLKRCPYCRKEHDFAAEDWLVTEIR
ncbi:hypothetical protein [Arcanobacterium hippocoleae]